MSPFEKLEQILESHGLPTAFQRQLFLFAGNGLSRLALTPGSGASPSFSRGVSWRQWVADQFDELANDSATWSYLEADGLSLSEGIQCIRDRADLPRDDLTRLYQTLWEQVEIASAPGFVHHAAVDTFHVIVTTNYDTLFERAAVSMGKPFRQWVVGVKPHGPHHHGPAGRVDLDIVKLHGSFPFEGNRDAPTKAAFESWWNEGEDKHLVAASKTYRKDLNQAFENVTQIFTHTDIQRGLINSAPDVRRAWFVAGHGLNSEDVLFAHAQIQASSKISTQPIVLTFAPSPSEGRRQGTINRQSIVREDGLRDRSTQARSDFFVKAFDTIRNSKAAPMAEHRPPQVFLVGQSSANYVTRIKEGPLALERSYATQVRTDGRPVNEYQVGGQVLVPALLLDAWACRPALYSTVGYDEHGATVMRHLMGTSSLDLRGVKQDRSVVTDCSYVVTYEDVRILIDSGTSNSKKVNDSVVRTDLIPALDRGLAEAAKQRCHLYLTKWFFEPVAAHVATWRQTYPQLEVFFETGTRGFEDATAFNDSIQMLGRHIDVLLASSLFSLRLIRPTMTRLTGAKNVVVNALSSSTVDAWDQEYKSLEEQLVETVRGRAVQNHVFVQALQWDLKACVCEMRKHVGTPHSYLIVTLGAAGAMVIQPDGRAYWIEAESTVPTATSSALGCGDIFRGAFMGTLIQESQTCDLSIELATRTAVHAGTTKFQHLRLADALDALRNHAHVRSAGSRLKLHDLSDPSTLDELARLVALE
ncbi:MAG: hypothetical protein EKK47_22275 [Burkholderiales bacterium]|nr:MAG: hypothetical protein EKK47_22275 [Burkholderiales bacterium]